MDLSDPTRAVTPTLDGPILAALAAAGRPLTVGDVAAVAVRGSEIGVRRSLARLVDQGIVRATVMGRNRVHELNRQHLAAPIADLLGGLRRELWRRLRDAISAWPDQPLLATVFGSAARGDGDADSDIDLLLVHPPLADEPRPRRVTKRVATLIADLAPAAPLAWEGQLDGLRTQVKDWTGNTLQLVDLSIFEHVDQSTRRTPLLENIDRDGIELVDRLGQLQTRKGRA